MKKIILLLLFSLQAHAILPMYSGQTTAIFDSNGTGVTSTATGLKVDASNSSVSVSSVTSGGNSLSIGASGQILVSGTGPVGSAPAQNPLAVSGVDQAGNKQPFTMVTGTNALLISTAAPPALTIHQGVISIGTTPVRLTVSGSAPNSDRVLLDFNLDSTSTSNCYYGSSSVANSGASRGGQVFAGLHFSFSNDAGDYYGVCTNASQNFYIVEQY